MNWRTWSIAAMLVIALPVSVVMLRDLLKPSARRYQLQHLSGAEAASILSSHIAAGAIEGWSEDGVYVRASRRELANIAEVLRREDQPRPQVALRFQLVEANGFAQKDSSIEAVESVLRGLFRFQGYRLVADAFVRSKEKRESSQVLVGADNVNYRLTVSVGEVLRRAQKSSAEIAVRLSDARLAAMGNAGLFLETSVQLPDGQTAVLGTARPDAQRGALILVVTPEIR
jgi:hypothetical protein